jgi:hypothetical protein
MPNHVTNIVASKNPEIAEALLNDVPDDSGKTVRTVDFEKIIPIPEGYIQEPCSHGHFGPTDPHRLCWYVWNRANWGTKWNAYDYEPVEGGVRFDTAWSHPFPVVKRLSEMFPDDEIRVEFADEDLGSNQGAYTIRNGRILEAFGPPDGTPEAMDHAAQLKYGMTYAELRSTWEED